MTRKKKKKILLIDDDLSLLTTLRDFLRFEGYEVTTADSGEKGLEELDSLKPDLVILDISMPGIGGVGFLKAVSSADGKPRYPVLVLTARSAMAEYFGEVDVAGFVAKPCDPQDLLMEVGRIIFLTAEEGVKSWDSSDARPQILLGEDDETRGKVLRDILIGAGFEVERVKRGPDLIERAIVAQPDVIVIKLIFGNMNGDTVARMLSELPKTHDIPIVLYDEGAADVSASEYGVDAPNIREFVHVDSLESLTEAVLKVAG